MIAQFLISLLVVSTKLLPLAEFPAFGWLCVEETWPEAASELKLGRLFDDARLSPQAP